MDVSFAAPEEAAGLIEAGELRILAVASPAREPAYADVPTLKELGWDVVVENMKGWVGPAGITDAMVAFHHDRFRQAMSGAAWRRFVERTREPDGYLNGADFQRAMDDLLGAITAALRRG